MPPRRTRPRRLTRRRPRCARGSAPRRTSRSFSEQDSVALAAEISTSAVIDYADIPGFPLSTVESHAGRLLCGTLARQDGRRDAGPISPVRGVFTSAGDVSGARDARARRRHAGRVERVWRTQSAVVGRRSDADRRSHQPARRQSADRPERRSARAALSRSLSAVRHAAARPSRATSRPSGASRCARVCTSR